MLAADIGALGVRVHAAHSGALRAVRRAPPATSAARTVDVRPPRTGAWLPLGGVSRPLSLSFALGWIQPCARPSSWFLDLRRRTPGWWAPRAHALSGIAWAPPFLARSPRISSCALRLRASAPRGSTQCASPKSPPALLLRAAARAVMSSAKSRRTHSDPRRWRPRWRQLPQARASPRGPPQRRPCGTTCRVRARGHRRTRPWCWRAFPAGPAQACRAASWGRVPLRNCRAWSVVSWGLVPWCPDSSGQQGLSHTGVFPVLGGCPVLVEAAAPSDKQRRAPAVLAAIQVDDAMAVSKVLAEAASAEGHWSH